VYSTSVKSGPLPGRRQPYARHYYGRDSAAASPQAKRATLESVWRYNRTRYTANHAYNLRVLEELVRSWTRTYDHLFKVPIVGDPRFDGVRDTDLAFQHEIDRSIQQTLSVWGVPHVVLDPVRRGDWSQHVLDTLLARLKPQELLFPELDKPLNGVRAG